jgi:sulfite reductase alpha subunit-like flavoprotein
MSFSHSDSSIPQDPVNAEAKTLECERLLANPNDDIHEGQISHTHGFVPYRPLMDEFPPEFKAWDDLAANLPTYLTQASEREKIQQLPVLDAGNIETLPDHYLARASAHLGNAAHAYYYNQRLGFEQENDPLPPSIRLPWEQVNARVGRQLPKYEPGKLKAIRGSYDAFLCNWRTSNPDLLDGVRNAELTLDDLSIHMPMFKNNAVRVFVLNILLMELRFAPALKPIIQAVKAVAEKNDADLLKALKKITEVVETISDALDYLTPNEHAKNYVDPTIWSRTIATFDGTIPGGLPGLSASVFPLFHTLDSFIERKDYDSVLGKAIVEKYEAQPRPVYHFIAALRRDLTQFSIRAYIEQSSNPLLKNQYQALMDSYLGNSGLTNIHASKAYGYLKINFRSGRLETNGNQRGTATVETEEQRQTIRNFSNADAERKKNHIPKPFYATKTKVVSLNGTTSEVVLDVSQTGLTFLPGDHCAVLPANTEDEVNYFIEKYQISDSLEVSLNKEWQNFFFTQFGQDITTAHIKQLLMYADKIRSIEHGDVFNADTLHPLSPRLYSVAPFANSSGKIRLTVGRHFYEANEEKQEARSEGRASGYLIHTSSAIHIDRAPARNFHLPANPSTPILMFAAGTGISPFMGFIDARNNEANSGLNWLFFSAQNRASFHYQDELRQAVAQDKLKLSVIFSREDENTAEFNAETGNFDYKKKYAGKHVDELIKENGLAICQQLQNGAHIYICGNNGFAKTVRDNIKSALLAHNKDWSESACDEYIDKLIANNVYHYDAFTPTVGEQAQVSRKILRSEVAYHNSINDCWMIINGSVYDLSRFIHVHPGGRKILHINGGMDASEDYNHVRHRESQQIEALLLQNKVGQLSVPDLQDEKSKTVYKKLIHFLESLLEMSNTLSNSSTFTETAPLYLWRETFSIFVRGNLNNYKNSEGVGSLKYVFGKLLGDLTAMLGGSSDHYAQYINPLFALASECSEIIRTATIGSSPEIIAAIEPINALILQQTLAFIDKMKRILIEFIHHLELSPKSEIDQKRLGALVKASEANMVDYLQNLQKARGVLSVFERKSIAHPFFSAPPTGGVCPFGFGRQQQPARSQLTSALAASQPESAAVRPQHAANNSMIHRLFNNPTVRKGAILLVGGLLIYNNNIDADLAFLIALTQLKKSFPSNGAAAKNDATNDDTVMRKKM